jgi:hypothetical protein
LELIVRVRAREVERTVSKVNGHLKLALKFLEVKIEELDALVSIYYKSEGFLKSLRRASPPSEGI